MITNNRQEKMKAKIEKAKLLFKSKANATNILKLVGLIDEIKKEETQKGKNANK
jgi:hypothetical protein